MSRLKNRLNKTANSTSDIEKLVENFSNSLKNIVIKELNNAGLETDDYDKNGFNKEGINKEGFTFSGMNVYTKTNYDKEGYDIFGENKYGIKEARKRIYVTTDSKKGALKTLAKEESDDAPSVDDLNEQLGGEDSGVETPIADDADDSELPEDAPADVPCPFHRTFRAVPPRSR
jgi:hypothetical protein